MRPIVSVITPLHQGEAFIAQCIESVASQSLKDIEHIIIDNNSTDAGPEIVRGLMEQYPHIRLLSSSPSGAGPTRNTGLENAKGRYIAFLDADDWWHHDKLLRQIELMQETGAVFSWTGYSIVDEHGTAIRTQAAPASLTYNQLLWKLKTIGCLTVVYDRDFYGERRMNSMPMRQDFCLWLDLLKSAEAVGAPVAGLKDTYAFYRVHGSGITADKKKAARHQWQAYREHVGLSKPVAALCFTSYATNAVLDRLSR